MVKINDTDIPYLEFSEAAAPGTPASAITRIYVKSDGLAYSKDDAGTETLMSGGAGGAPTTANYLVGTAHGSLSAEIIVGTVQAYCDGRLTLTTALPVTTADVTAATTLYFTPFRGNRISTYSGTAWSTSNFTEKSITLASLTAGLPYDVYIVDSTLALELTAWTNATTRATALTTQDGVLVKTGVLTRRYLGTICIKATGQSEDSLLNRFVWNYYNRVERKLKVTDTTDSWTWNSATYHQANAAAGNKVEYVCGVSEDLVKARVHAQVSSSGITDGNPGIGIDATNANSADLFFNFGTVGVMTIPALYAGYPGVGYHYIAWLESARAGTPTFYGDQGIGANTQSGLLAEVWG